jgi:hypothetical protein
MGCLSVYRNADLRLITTYSVVAVVTSNYIEGSLENVRSSSVIGVYLCLCVSNKRRVCAVECSGSIKKEHDKFKA